MEWFKKQKIQVKIILIFFTIIAVITVIGYFGELSQRIDITYENIKGNWVKTYKDKDKDDQIYYYSLLDNNKMKMWNVYGRTRLIAEGEYKLSDSKLEFISNEGIDSWKWDITGLTSTEIYNDNKAEIKRTEMSPEECTKFYSLKKLKQNLDKFKSGSQWTYKALGDVEIMLIDKNGRFETSSQSGSTYKGEYKIDMETGRIDFQYERAGDIYGIMTLSYEIDVYSMKGKYYYTMVTF